MLLSSSFLLLPACSRACFGHLPSSQFATEDSDPQFASCRRGGPPPPVHGAATAEACRPGASPPPVRRAAVVKPLHIRSATPPLQSPFASSPLRRRREAPPPLPHPAATEPLRLRSAAGPLRTRSAALPQGSPSAPSPPPRRSSFVGAQAAPTAPEGEFAATGTANADGATGNSGSRAPILKTIRCAAIDLRGRERGRGGLVGRVEVGYQVGKETESLEREREGVVHMKNINL
ncbi:hypothetical protein PVAP13_4NG189838 [Panicum virgatum]|uniref:Uncharacterized protein n=1 Tax=Panicum virgatum TaxID=38727 RepID=A0A8T0T0T8_PANVG|nr:hypothetical protein PVAP13_4NG189838 [Panicum virgatum]